MECRKCKGTVLKKIAKNYIVHLPYKGKIESYKTNLVLYYCLHCGNEWWDESLPDPKVDVILQYIEHHGREDRESKSLIKRFSL
jgi:uncharacterized protein with PIN domain